MDVLATPIVLVLIILSLVALGGLAVLIYWLTGLGKDDGDE